MSEEQDKGNPPPSMSSRDGMPVDVIMVDRDDGDRRVPGDILGCLEVVFLLKEDMVDKVAVRSPFPSPLLVELCHEHDIPSYTTVQPKTRP